MTVTDVHVAWRGESLMWDLTVDVEVDSTRTVRLYGSIPTLAQVTEATSQLIANWHLEEAMAHDSDAAVG